MSAPGAAFAQSAASTEIAALKAEIAALAERLERLERGPTAEAGAAREAAPAVPLAARADRAVEISGDLRYRHETVNDDAFPERQRQRLRARLGFAADVTDDVEVGLTLATGDDDPVSANQTLDGGFSRKSIGVDRAFVTWRANDELTFTGGKMPIPFFRPGNHPLIYDGDLNPEGLALRYARGDWFASFAGLWVEERAASEDSLLLGGQLGYRVPLAGGKRLTAGLAYYDYRNTQGQTPFWDGAAAGNRLDAAGGYLNDFNVAEAFTELSLRAGERPLTLFADYVVNTQAAGEDTGYAIGGSLGEITRPGAWRVGYAYQKLEADAVVGTFTDSDFAGGGTDGKGHVIDFALGLRDHWTFAFKYFLDTRGAAAGNERDYDRLQADLNFSF